MGFFSRNKNKEKFDVAEAAKQLKRSTNMSKNANPLKAMTEEEPWAQAQGRNIAISQLKHKDMHGNEIVEPDRSNPTRYRFERPLDTIRNFERAIHRDDRERDPKRRSVRNSRNTEDLQGNYSRGQQDNQSNYGRNMNDSPGRGPSDSFENTTSYPENNIQSRNPYAPRNRSNTENFYNPEQNRVIPVSAASDNETGNISIFSGEGVASTQDRYSTDPSSESSSYGRRESDNYTTGQYKPGHGLQPSQGANSYDGSQYTYNNGMPARQNGQPLHSGNPYGGPTVDSYSQQPQSSAAQYRGEYSYGRYNVRTAFFDSPNAQSHVLGPSPPASNYADQSNVNNYNVNQGPQIPGQQPTKEPFVTTNQRPQQNPYPSYQSAIPRSFQQVQTPVVTPPAEKRKSWLKSKFTRT